MVGRVVWQQEAEADEKQRQQSRERTEQKKYLGSKGKKKQKLKQKKKQKQHTARPGLDAAAARFAPKDRAPVCNRRSGFARVGRRRCLS